MKKHKVNYVYLVRCYKIDLKSTEKRVVRDRTWGFFKDLKIAQKCVLENWTDIFEHNYYDHAVVLKMPEGVCVKESESYWYKITYSKNGSKHKVKLINIDPINYKRNKNSKVKYFIGW